jgi:hypothetical protein
MSLRRTQFGYGLLKGGGFLRNTEAWAPCISYMEKDVTNPRIPNLGQVL